MQCSGCTKKFRQCKRTGNKQPYTCSQHVGVERKCSLDHANVMIRPKTIVWSGSPVSQAEIDGQDCPPLFRHDYLKPYYLQDQTEGFPSKSVLYTLRDGRTAADGPLANIFYAGDCKTTWRRQNGEVGLCGWIKKFEVTKGHFLADLTVAQEHHDVNDMKQFEDCGHMGYYLDWGNNGVVEMCWIDPKSFLTPLEVYKCDGRGGMTLYACKNSARVL